MHLPQNLTPTDFDTRYRHDSQAWLPAIVDICKAHGLPTTPLVSFPDGSNLIAAAADEFVVKVFPPFHRDQWESERRTLAHLAAHDISISIPQLAGQGEREDRWTYVILSKLPGVTLERVWPSLTTAEKAGCMRQIGRVMAEVHAIPVGGLSDLDPLWASFLPKQIAQCKTRHTRLGMPEWFLREVENYVMSKEAPIPDEPSVILTGEYTPFNLLAGQINSQWQITGMIDFGDAMVGFREYDFLGPCLFLGEGNGSLIDALFDGYRYTNPRFDAALRRRLMTLAILHRYSHLRAQIRIDDWPSRVQSLQDLEQLIFPSPST